MIIVAKTTIIITFTIIKNSSHLSCSAFIASLSWNNFSIKNSLALNNMTLDEQEDIWYWKDYAEDRKYHLYGILFPFWYKEERH